MSVVSNTYSKALLAAAKTNKALPQVVADMQALRGLFVQAPEILKAFQNKSIEISSLYAVVDAMVKDKSLNKITGNFMKALIQVRRMTAIDDIFLKFNELVQQENNEVVASVTSARPLEKKYASEITKILEQQIGRKVFLYEEVNPDIIGGIIVQVGSKVYDASLRTQLNGIKIGLERLES